MSLHRAYPAVTCGWLLVVAACLGSPHGPVAPGIGEPTSSADAVAVAPPAVESDTTVEPGGATGDEGTGNDAGPGEAAAPATAAPTAPSVVALPTHALAGAETCSVEEPAVLGTVDGRLPSLVAAFGPRGGLAAWPQDAENIQTAPFDATGRPAGPAATSAMPAANRNILLAAVGDRFLLATHAVCPDERRYHKCLHLLALAADGTTLGPVTTEDTGGWVDIVGLATTADALLLLEDFVYETKRLVRYRIGEDGAVAVEVVHTFSELDAGGDRLLQALALDGDRWFVLFDADMPPIGETLVTADGSAQVDGLPPEFEVQAFEWDGEAVAAIVAQGESRPVYARIGLDGRLIEARRKLERGETPPAPFAERLTGELEWEAGDLRLVRRTLARDRVGTTTEVAHPRKSRSDHAPHALVWTGEVFVAVFGDHDGAAWSIQAARIVCRSEAPAP